MATDRGIKGHRALSSSEIELMNLLKGHEETLESLLKAVRAHLEESGDRSAERWLSLARDHFETGMMFALKAVARPKEGLGRMKTLGS